MADVRLDFVPPDLPDLTKLIIYESSIKEGTYAPIEEVTAVGAYPDYISYYTTENATQKNYWFAIEWEDSKGAQFGMSQPLQGGTNTLVGEISLRVLQRDPSADEKVVVQEAQAAVQTVFKVADPMSLSVGDATAKQLSGLVLLTMARVSLTTLIASSQSQSYTAGLVSQKTSQGAGADRELIAYLLKEASTILGMSFSVVMLLEDIDPTGLGSVSVLGIDQSRLLLSIE